jgi:hypothetical protein
VSGGMRVRLRDVVTGEEADVTDNVSVFDWTENNWSCDCNRADYFDHLDLSDSGYCIGAHRYYVVAVDPMPDGFTLADFNAGYPNEEP